MWVGFEMTNCWLAQSTVCWAGPVRQRQQRLVAGPGCVSGVPPCGHLENEVWVSEGQNAQKSRELEVGLRGAGWVWSVCLLPWHWAGGVAGGGGKGVYGDER